MPPDPSPQLRAAPTANCLAHVASESDTRPALGVVLN